MNYKEFDEKYKDSFFCTWEFQVIIWIFCGASLSWLLWPLGILAFIAGGIYMFDRILKWAKNMVGEEMVHFIWRLFWAFVLFSIPILILMINSR